MAKKKATKKKATKKKASKRSNSPRRRPAGPARLYEATKPSGKKSQHPTRRLARIAAGNSGRVREVPAVRENPHGENATDER